VLERSPVDPSRQPGYPSLGEHGEARRRFLKLAALSSAGLALGLPLTGCPGGPGGGGLGAGGGGNSWLPWNEPEHLAGEVAMPMGAPVGVVVGGGPIPVTFQDGTQVKLVVAAVVTPLEGMDVQGDFVRLSQTHAQLVTDEAKGVPASVLSDAAALDAFEAKLFDRLVSTLSSGYLDEVSAAKAEPESASAPEPARESEAADVAYERAEEAAPAEAAAEPAAVPVKPSLSASRIWAACRRPGCTTCGAR
jgi:hypothetical protein